MGEIHNLQIVISQSPLLNRLNEARHNNAAANGAQILNVIDKKNTDKKLSSVRGLDESEKTEKEDPRKRRLKKSASDKLIDLYG